MNMKIDKRDIVFIIPSYNEENRIVNTIASILNMGFSEVIVVDDGSSDATQRLLTREFPNSLHSLRHVINR
jgi:glycosyltransferase involved in cell wall biosynthesis